MYFIDSKDDLWVYGSNSASNKLGLTAEQSVEYTGREAMKVNLNGKKVKKVFPGTDTTFILTTDNVLMAAGLNTLGQLGLGDTHSTTVFEKVEVPNAQNIETVYCSDNHSQANVIKYKDNTFYFAGSNGFGGLGTGKNEENYKIFTQIWNGVIGPDIDQDVKDVMWDCQTVILKKDGTVWVAGYTGYLMGNLPSGSNFQFRKHNIENVKKMYKLGATDVVLEKENEIYCMNRGYIDKNNNLWVSGDSRFLGLGVDSASYKNIPNYIMCPDNNIKGKAKEVIFARSNLCFNNR